MAAMVEEQRQWKKAGRQSHPHMEEESAEPWWRKKAIGKENVASLR